MRLPQQQFISSNACQLLSFLESHPMKSCMHKFPTTLGYQSPGHHALPFFLVGSIVSLVHALLIVFSWGMPLLKNDIGVMIQSLKHCINSLHLSSSVLKPGG